MRNSKAGAGCGAWGGDPETFHSESGGPERHTLADGTCPHIKLSGNEIRYLSVKAGRGVELARAVGDARIEVSAQHGFYFCRADEIHYRARRKEVILLGNPSISACHAPHIDQFGLVRIDLSQCTAEYPP